MQVADVIARLVLVVRGAAARNALVSLVLAASACGPADAAPKPTQTPASGGTTTNDAPPTPSTPAVTAATTPEGPPRAGESRVLVGTLRYTEIPEGVRSVAAYRSEDLTLVGDGGQSWNLGGSQAVTEAQLVALAGKRIEVTATYVPPAAPDPDMAAPMDGDAPMEIPARWEVTAVRGLTP
jgi:hypothetical protein